MGQASLSGRHRTTVSSRCRVHCSWLNGSCVLAISDGLTSGGIRKRVLQTLSPTQYCLGPSGNATLITRQFRSTEPWGSKQLKNPSSLWVLTSDRVGSNTHWYPHNPQSENAPGTSIRKPTIIMVVRVRPLRR